MTSASSMNEAGHPKSLLWDNPDGLGEEAGGEEGSGWGTHVHPWWIHVNVWQKLLQYCQVINLH